MSYEYLNGKQWADITRTESHFCSELYRIIHADPRRFLRLLQLNDNLGLTISGRWEVATEVCFYRDMRIEFPGGSHDHMYSPKRTFDMCLFGPSQVVILEAKAHQEMPFAEAQRARQDAKNLTLMLGLRNRATLVALVSSRYLENHNKYSRKKPLCSFDTVLTWAALAQEYQNRFFERADCIYKDNRRCRVKQPIY